MERNKAQEVVSNFTLCDGNQMKPSILPHRRSTFINYSLFSSSVINFLCFLCNVLYYGVLFLDSSYQSLALLTLSTIIPPITIFLPSFSRFQFYGQPLSFVCVYAVTVIDIISPMNGQSSNICFCSVLLKPIISTENSF